MLEINVRKVKTIAVIDLSGTIDIDSANLIERIGWCLTNGYKNIICNFECVNLVDYAGLSVIAIAYKNILNQKGRIKLIKVPMHIKKIFSLVCMDKVFDIYDDSQSALKSFETDSAIAEIQRKKLRRRFKRVPLDVQIQFKQSFKEDSFHKGKVLNISGVGLLVYSEKIYALSDILDIKLTLQPEPGVIEVRAIVVWLVQKEIQPQIYPAMGLEFYDMDSPVQEKIVKYVERNLP